MKECTYCGKEFPDSVTVCDIDGQPVVAPGSKPGQPQASWSFRNAFPGFAAYMSARALVASIGAGMLVPAKHVQVASACYPWILLGVMIALGCCIGVSFVMSKLDDKLKPRTFLARQCFSLGCWTAPVLTYFVVLWIVKSSQ